MARANAESKFVLGNDFQLTEEDSVVVYAAASCCCNL